LREVFVFRFYECDANQHPELESVGTASIPGLLRQVTCSRGDETWNRLKSAYERALRFRRTLFTSVSAQRSFEIEERAHAALYVLRPSRFIDASFEESGAEYDESTACAVCGSGGLAVPPIGLPAKYLGTREGILETLGGELVVSMAVKRALESEHIAGVTFDDVSPIGGGTHDVSWHRLRVTGATIDLSKRASASLVPFDTGWPDQSSCGHIAGYSLMSQAWLCLQHEKQPAGFLQTMQYLGVRRGLLRPSRIVVAAPDVYSCFARIGLAMNLEPACVESV
jgi:hypothetical protein